jgi:radical SAM protein with 4Fe4S-binding SPASM domain
MSKSCPLPFNQLFLQSSGRVYPCTFLQNKLPLGDVKQSSLKDIWESKAAINFREAHLKGECEECESNKKKYGCHLLQEGMRAQTSFDSKYPGNIKRLDFMIDSFCNLKCIMCTNIYEDRGGFEDPAFWEQITVDIFPKLKEVEIIGGEPFLVKDSFKLIRAVRQVNPRCQWVITTNGAYKLSKEMIDVIKTLNLRLLSLSLDSVREETFNKIRIGGNLNQCLNTFKQIVQLKHDHKLTFKIELNMVIQEYNAYEALDILSYCDSLSIDVYFILLKYPDKHSLFSQSPETQSKVFTFYMEAYERNNDPRLLRLLLKLYASLCSTSQQQCFPFYAKLI